jgi:hypothetical protein
LGVFGRKQDGLIFVVRGSTQFLREIIQMEQNSAESAFNPIATISSWIKRKSQGQAA